MPITGRVGRQRIVTEQAGYKRLGSCPQDDGGVGLAALPELPSIDVAFADIPMALSPDLSDEFMRMPMLLADPNVAGALAPIEGTRPQQWGGYLGGMVNGMGCEEGQSPGVFARIRRMPIGGLFVVEQFVLTKLGDGSCQMLQIFMGGGQDIDGVITGPVTAANQAAAGGAVPGVLATAAGSVTLSLPS